MKHRLLILSCSLLILFLPIVFGDMTYGISPPRIIAEELLPGSHYEQKVLISAFPIRDDVILRFKMNGTLEPWMQLVGPRILNSNTTKLWQTVVIDVPLDAKLGDYSGEVLFQLDPAKVQNRIGTSISVILPLNIKVAVIDEQVYAPMIRHVRVQSVDDNMLNIEVDVMNEGNIPVSSLRAQVSIFDKFKQEQLKSYDLLKLDSVEPFTEGTVKVTIPHSLSSDQYWAKVVVSDDKQQLHTEFVIFDVLQWGRELYGQNIVSVYSRDVNDLIRGHSTSLIVGIIIIALLLIIFVLYRNKKSFSQ